MSLLPQTLPGVGVLLPFQQQWGRVLGLLALHLESACLWFSSFDCLWSLGIWCCTMEEWMKPIQSHTLCSILLVIDCKGLNRNDGLDLSQLMTLLFPPCLSDVVVFGKGDFTNPGSIHPCKEHKWWGGSPMLWCNDSINCLLLNCVPLF